MLIASRKPAIIAGLFAPQQSDAQLADKVAGIDLFGATAEQVLLEAHLALIGGATALAFFLDELAELPTALATAITVMTERISRQWIAFIAGDTRRQLVTDNPAVQRAEWTANGRTLTLTCNTSLQPQQARGVDGDFVSYPPLTAQAVIR